MSDKKLSELTSGTAEGTDIVYGVKDPAGTPVDRKIAISSIKDYILGLANTWTQNQTFSGGVNKVTITAPASSATLTIADGKTLTASNSLTLAGTDSTTMTFPGTSGTVATLNASNLFTTAQTISPTTDVIALTARGAENGTANILQLQDSNNGDLGSFDKDGKLTLGSSSAKTGTLKFANATNNNVVTIESGTSSENVTYTLPVADGSDGQVLSTNGSGVLSWKTDADTDTIVDPAGSDTQVQFNDNGSFGASANLSWSSPALTLGVQETTKGQLVLANTADGAYSTTLQSSNSATAAWTLTLPVTAGTSGQCLATDGSGNASWKTVEQLTGVTYANLPGSPTAGYLAYVTDSTTEDAAWGATISEGGGTYKYLIWYNGTAWKVVGK